MYLVLQSLFLCSQVSSALTLVPFPSLIPVSAACFHPYVSLQTPYPKCSLLLLLSDSMHSPAFTRLLVPAVFQLQFSAAFCSCPPSSASPQMLGLQLLCPVLSPMSFSEDFFCSPAHLLLHPYLGKESPPHSVSSAKSGATGTLGKYEVWATYKVESFSGHRETLTEGNKHQEI